MKVWYRPQPQPGRDKWDPKWKLPGVVLRRVADHSYVVQVEEGNEQEAHRSHLHPHGEDKFSDQPFPLYYFSGQPPLLELGPDDWEVEEISDHKMNKEVLHLNMKWKGWSKPTWEPYYNVGTNAMQEYVESRGLTFRLEGWKPPTVQ